MKKLLTKLYILAFMALVVYFGVIIWNLTFAHIIHEYHERHAANMEHSEESLVQKEKVAKSFEQVILNSETRTKQYLGYRVLEQQYIEGHFHHIGFDVGPDRHSYCSSCHGDMPHDSVTKDLRAFLNMHAFFIGCQTCHSRPEGEMATGVYKWYARETGEIIPSPVNDAPPGTYKAKIIPFVMEKGSIVRIDSQAKRDFVEQYRLNEKELTEGQKSKSKNIIHNIVSKKPVICEECHSKEKPLLPLADLGYSERRVDSITSTEVVGMIKNYTKFYMPKMLNPGVSHPVDPAVDPVEPVLPGQLTPSVPEVESLPPAVGTEG
ncbi:MAG: hypothetical protein KJ804_19175 [Proteobacteria bacterium]|nr:hypothetical protein [Pseudomonadota bacterium]MBU1060432.1 hypothetical protein [Pseudomonadota bacterium]